MHNVIPLEQVSRETVRDLAHAAADNGEPPSTNPFPQDHPNHRHWEHDFLERSRDLAFADG